jgi:hypothetical protein
MVTQLIICQFVFFEDTKIQLMALLILFGILKCQQVCNVVESSFADILAQWSFFDFRADTKIFQSPVAKYYDVGSLLVNI